jgi:hypothetical protein
MSVLPEVCFCEDQLSDLIGPSMLDMTAGRAMDRNGPFGGELVLYLLSFAEYCQSDELAAVMTVDANVHPAHLPSDFGHGLFELGNPDHVMQHASCSTRVHQFSDLGTRASSTATPEVRLEEVTCRASGTND